MSFKYIAQLGQPYSSIRLIPVRQSDLLIPYCAPDNVGQLPKSLVSALYSFHFYRF